MKNSIDSDRFPPRPGASRPPRHQQGRQGASNTTSTNDTTPSTTFTATRAPLAGASSNSNRGRNSGVRSNLLAPLPPLPANLRGNPFSTTEGTSTSERSRLLPITTRTNNNPQQQQQQERSFPPFRRSPFDNRNFSFCSVSWFSATGVIIMSLVIFIVTYIASVDDTANNALEHWLFPDKPTPRKPYYAFPDNFTWGVAASAYQIEGGGGGGAAHHYRDLSIWDVFCTQPHTIADGSDGSVACDHYHRMHTDVQLMASLNIRAYRFSISWPRLLSSTSSSSKNGTTTTTTTVSINPDGLRFYNTLIDTLLRYEIEPWVTLFHWDLPQIYMENFQAGWMNTSTAHAFAQYASICFEAFGDRVRRWITLNEAWTVAVNGHATGIHAPGHQSLTEPYIVGHNLLLAHGLAVQAFREYQNRTNTATSTTDAGMIGIANCGDFRYPLTVRDNSTAEQVMLFQFGWMSDPLFFGDYPSVMRERLGTRLPQFTTQQRKLLVGSVDFVGLNYYSSLQASKPATPAAFPGYWTSDIDADLRPHPDWRLNDMGWAVVPDGLRNMLVWIARRYNNPLVYITENGDAEHRDAVKPLLDTFRQDYLQGHLRAAGQAMELGVNLGGYFAWTLLDNFEWQFGYTKKFGLVKVDFADGSLRRTPKASAYWYNRTIVAQGKNIHRQPPISWWPSV